MTGSACPQLRARLRRMFMGLSTVTGLARNGYFIPYSLASSLPGSTSRAGYPAWESTLAGQAPEFAAFALRMGYYLADLVRAASAGSPDPRLDQDWFPPLDALAAYTMVREIRPRTILEIGGGHSTRVFVRAATDAGLAAAITVVDPRPRRALVVLEEHGQIILHRAPVQLLTPDDLPPLGPNDILSLDGSHILMPGSDTDTVLNRILPHLPHGVRIHFHDIFLPDPYPEDWDWRGYNEQQGVAVLLAGGTAKVLFASHYVMTRLPEVAQQAGLGSLPRSPAPASSLWIQWQG